MPSDQLRRTAHHDHGFTPLVAPGQGTAVAAFNPNPMTLHPRIDQSQQAYRRFVLLRGRARVRLVGNLRGIEGVGGGRRRQPS